MHPIIIAIEGRHRHKDIVAEYVSRLCEELSMHRLERIIFITFMSHLDNHHQGLCVGEKDLVDISIGTKNVPFLLQMQALAHEMVHAKQFLREELSAEGSWKWKGRNANNYAYANQPWEREAYKLEKVLFMSCFPFELYDV